MPYQTTILGMVRALLALTALTAPTGVAQPLSTDLIVGDHRGTIFRVNPATNTITTIGSYAPAGRFLWDVTVDANDKDVIASIAPTGLSTGELVAVDLVSGAATTVATGVSSVLTQLDENGDYILGTLRKVLRVNRSTQAVTTLHTSRSAALADRDVSTGNWLIADLTQLLAYDPATSAIVNTLAIGTSGHMSFATDPSSFDAYTANFGLFRIDTRNGVTTQLPPFLGLGPVGDQAFAIDRAPGTSGELVYVYGTVSSTNRILVVDRNGVMIRSLGPFANQPTGIAFDRGRNLAPVLNVGPNDRSLVVSFANAGGLLYTVVFSLSGSSPGVRLPDGRLVALNLDPLSTLTFAGPLPPLVNGNTGRLDASGRKVMTLNLNSLGTAISGTRLWAVAVALDPSAPLGVAQISAPTVIVL